MDAKPDTIKIPTSYREEIFATHADLFVTVRGSSIISGDEAMKKAKEVSQLLGVYDFIENTVDQEAPMQSFYPQTAAKTRSAGMLAEPNLGMDARHSKMIHVNADIWYRISEFM
jgi:hypothetical protein